MEAGSDDAVLPGGLSSRERVRRRRARRSRLPTPVLLIAPSLIFMTALFAWPLVVGVGQAFVGDNGPTLQYARQMLDDPYFWPSVRNTALLIVVLIPVQFTFAITMALMLRARPRFAGFYFYVWMVPLAISDLAAGLVWLSVFADRGYLNSALEIVHIGSYSWLSYQHPVTLFITVLIAELWRATSLVLVIVVAGLQGIPKDYDEAAEVFGASYWQRLRWVILPQLRPSLQVAMILRTVLALETFAVAQALTGQDFPLLVGNAYRWADLQQRHLATIIALVVLAISLLTSTVYLRLLRDRTNRVVP